MIQQHSSVDGINDLASSLRLNRHLDIHLQYKAGIPLCCVGDEAIFMQSISLQTLPDDGGWLHSNCHVLTSFWPNSTMAR